MPPDLRPSDGGGGGEGRWPGEGHCRSEAHRQQPCYLEERRRGHDPHPLRLRQPPLHHQRPLPAPSSSAARAGDADGVDVDPSEAELRLEVAQKVVLRWDASDSLLWESSPEEAEEYLAAVDDLIFLADPGTSSSAAAAAEDLVSRAEVALQMAMSRLEEEFRHLMVRNAVPLDSNGLCSSIRRLSSLCI
ncbi:exo70 exocyst complex subunit domain containing protein [Musa troglodytarum]|uniref:Exo70 exocyst complex subunit domain containing protein n=1 Tax=Musa troglodytarum TaxID=320322 RepID=A0A9E7GGW4_9LILI|nr:exo70 exocyst complex subunit domain containing protein [Musa troglodytarum]